MQFQQLSDGAGAVTGIVNHHVESEFQNGRQQIHVLVPDDYKYSGASYRVIYVLPVEKSGGCRRGQPLHVLCDMDAHNRYRSLIVFITTAEEPWFADHATDPKTRQASYINEFVVPYIDRNYRTIRESSSRFLLGFSKSGWGAYHLIFSHQDLYGFAAAWDAPFLVDQLIYEMDDAIGTTTQLTSCRPDLAARRTHDSFRDRSRLVIAGENLFGKLVPPPVGDSHVVEMQRILQDEGIRHTYLEGISPQHTFNRDWMEPTLRALMNLAP